MRRKPLWIFAALLAVGAGGTFLFSGSPQADAKTAFAEAQQHLKTGDLRAARVALLNAVKVDPKSRAALMAQAEVSLALFDAASAQVALERALAIGVPKPQIAHLLGSGLLDAGRACRCRNGSDRKQIFPLPTALMHGVSSAASRWTRAIQSRRWRVSTKPFSLAPDDSRNWTDLGRLRFVLANQKGAIEAVERALQLDPEDVRALEFRGVLMRSQFGVVAALPWFERGLQIAPSDVPLLEEYALTLGEAGRYRDMLTQARKIVGLDRGNPKAYYMQAVLAARAGNCTLAKRILPKAGSNFTELPGPMLLDAICELELGNTNRAVDQLQRLLAQQPRNRRVRTLLAQALYKAGQPLDALDTIREIAARPDADSYSLMLTARAFAASGQPQRAVDPLNDAAVSVVRPAQPLPEPVSLIGAADAARREPENARAVLPYIRLLAAAGELDAAFVEAARLASQQCRRGRRAPDCRRYRKRARQFASRHYRL